MGICYIIGAGECSCIDFDKNENDLVICADGGLRYAEEFGVDVDYIVGDFDSYGMIPDKANIVVLPCEKDVTDTHYAINYAMSKGYKSFRLYGMLGGRIDHSLANIQLLSYIVENGGEGVLVGDNYDVTIVKNGRLTLKGECGKYISVFSYTPESKGVSIKGLKYEVSNSEFTFSNPIGVSNEFIENTAFVEVAYGTLIVAIQK